MPKADLKSLSTAVAVITAKPIDLEKLPDLKCETGFAFDAEHLGKIALAMLAHVEGLKSERAKKGVLAGVYLQQVKAALGHGPFNAWCAKHLGKSKRMGEYYMALAAKFARSTKLLLPEVIGANQLTLALEAKGSDAQAFKAKLEKFVGDRGLTELMQKHGVIKRGGNQRQTTTAEETTPPPDSLRPEAQAYDDFVQAVEGAERVLLDDARWTVMPPDLAARVEPLLKRLLTRYHDRLLQAKHEAA